MVPNKVILVDILIQPKLIVEVSIVLLIVHCLLYGVLLAQLETSFAKCIGILVCFHISCLLAR